jgi:hypothetical protein
MIPRTHCDVLRNILLEKMILKYSKQLDNWCDLGTGRTRRINAIQSKELPGKSIAMQATAVPNLYLYTYRGWSLDRMKE